MATLLQLGDYVFPLIASGDGYKIIENSWPPKEETISTDGYPVRTYSKYGQTTIDLSFRSDDHAAISEILAQLDAKYAEFQYWSPLHGVMRKAYFYVDSSPVTVVSSLGDKFYQGFTARLTQKATSSDVTQTILTKYATAVDASDGTWVNPNNIKANDGSYATTDGYYNIDWDLVLSGFDFSAIPDTAVLSSLGITMEYKVSTPSSVGDVSMWIAYKGTLRGSKWISSAKPTSDSVANTRMAGGWTIAQLKSADLAMYIRVRRRSHTACTFSFDYATISIGYREVS